MTMESCARVGRRYRSSGHPHCHSSNKYAGARSVPGTAPGAEAKSSEPNRSFYSQGLDILMRGRR